MKILVMAKQVPDTFGQRNINLDTGMLERYESEPVPDEINERGLEAALNHKDDHPETEVIVLCMGKADSVKSMRKLLSMGADSAVLVADDTLSGSDAVQTSLVLTAAVQRIAPDMVLAGMQSTDGGGGLVPAMVAERLGWSILPGIEELSIADVTVRGRLRGPNSVLQLAAELPAVVSVTEKIAEARFPNFKGIMQAKKKPLEIWDLAQLGIDAGPDAAQVRSVMVSAQRKPERQAGTRITDDGTAAKQLSDFLATRRLI